MALEEVTEKKWDGRLSYSSWSLFRQCEKKYWHKKIGKTPIDKDADPSTDALDLGSAFHKVLEDTKHNVDGLKASKIKEMVEEFNLDWEKTGPLLCAMLKHYGVLHKRGGLKVIHCEFEISTPSFIGYIDAIMEDKKGLWWILDLKTYASFHESIPAKLHRDPQLNLYAQHAGDIAAALGLKLAKFGGVRYRVATKSKAARKEGQSFSDFYERLLKSVAAYDVPVPKELLTPTLIHDVFKEDQGRISELHKLSPETAERASCNNFRSCMDFFRPCEWWSRCHGKTYTDSMGQLKVSTST